MKNLLCKIGWHKYQFKDQYLPNMFAKIVTDYIAGRKCIRCNKLKTHIHLTWNGKDMVNKND